MNRIFHKHQDTMIRADIKAGTAGLRAEHIILNVNNIIQMILYAVLAFLALYENLSIGSVIVILTYFSSLTESLERVSSNYMDAQNRISIIQRMKDLMDQPMVDPQEDKEVLKVRKGEVEFREISFSYQNNEPIIENLNLHIGQGEKIAIVGESGCGKTTLSYMLLGFYKPGAGEIRIDGKRISRLHTGIYPQ